MIALEFLALGLAAGVLYFASLWWTAQLLATSGLTVGVASLIVLRLAALATLLYLSGRDGALPLLMMALGVFAGRAAVLRSARVTL
jgi:F1F0 ATPase subunit 2